MATMTKAIHRVRNTKNSSYLTHGGDDHDHKGLNKARRMMDKAIINEQLNDKGETLKEAIATAKAEAMAQLENGEITFRVVVTTQIHENYGAHNWDGEGECPSYWKAKGGNEYHQPIGTLADCTTLGSKGLQDIAQQVSDKVAKNDDYYQEHTINWEVIPSTEETHDERMYREMHEEGYLFGPLQDSLDRLQKPVLS